MSVDDWEKDAERLTQFECQQCSGSIFCEHWIANAAQVFRDAAARPAPINQDVAREIAEQVSKAWPNGYSHRDHFPKAQEIIKAVLDCHYSTARPAPITEIGEAVKVLNEKRWRDRNNWQPRGDYEVISLPVEDDDAMPKVAIYVEDALAIANWLQVAPSKGSGE